jgi:hypothetical protein
MSAKRFFGDGDFGHLKRDIAAVTHELSAYLDELVVSDQSLIGSGVASVRRKFPRL